ncbi:MAG: hypothetical protein HYV97_12300 [Bdellovibrio sp.]|nr:hypothetical protein [Bdellovibrio sp.]
MSSSKLKKGPGGEFPNFLGILSLTDKTKFCPKIFFSVTGLEKVEFSVRCNLSRPLLYKDEIDLKLLKDLKNGILQIVFATDLAFELFKYDTVETRHIALHELTKEQIKRLKAQTVQWLCSPSQLLFGKSPLDVCLLGKGHELIRWLQAKLGYEEGVSVVT